MRKLSLGTKAERSRFNAMANTIKAHYRVSILTHYMNPEFAEHIANLDSQLTALMASPALQAPKLSLGLPAAGVYLFTEFGTHLYVGRSNDLRERIQIHGRGGSKTWQAAFAYRLARAACGVVKVSYAAVAPEDDFSLKEPFLSEFRAAKQRIRQMEVRVIGEPQPVRQMLLEAYVAVSLRTPYNDFDNH
jgi:predicted GIY-YIG superfamily endonuclease